MCKLLVSVFSRSRNTACTITHFNFNFRPTFRNMSDQKAKPKRAKPMEPRPSSSVILVSPLNQVLLLHRVKTSSSFASAHVFPGGNVDASHDGVVPDVGTAERHVDSKVYRMAAIRETFEESGILLAKYKNNGGLLSVPDNDREEGRKAIHSGKITFPDWLAQRDGVADIDNLIPFTRWITPGQVPRRFTTQMYIYFLPLPTIDSSDATLSDIGPLPSGTQAVIPVPTHDGGIEHTEAKFLPSQKWLDLAGSGEVILFPPQFFLLTMVAKFLQPTSQDAYQNVDLLRQRRELETFARAGQPPWADVCTSPIFMGTTDEGKVVLSMAYPGDEVKGLGRKGIEEYVIVMGGKKRDNQPNNIEILLRKDVQKILAGKL